MKKLSIFLEQKILPQKSIDGGRNNFIKNNMTREEKIQKWADEHSAKKQSITIGAWVARDINKVVALHRVKPKCWEGFYLGNVMTVLDKNDFPEVTFENSPKKVKITIEIEEDKE